MRYPNPSPSEDEIFTPVDHQPVLRHFTGVEMALQATTHLAVLFAFSLAFLLILAHQT